MSKQMTINYIGIQRAYEVKPAKHRLINVIKAVPAKNNAKRKVVLVEVCEIDEFNINVTKSNLNSFHTYFTNEPI